MRSYDHPIEVSYRFPAAAVATAAVLGRVIGPAGASGRVLSLTHIVTTDVTVAPSVITVDTGVGVTTPVTMTIPVSAANSGGSASDAAIKAGSELPADTVVEVSSDGGATAGAADISLTIGWF
jgi:hypothetical protein